MRLTLGRIAAVIRAVGDLCGREDAVVECIRTDSRTLKPGEIFACLQGTSFDGHNFAREAMNKGAAAVLAERPLPELENFPVLIVRDVLHALGELAAYLRNEFRGKVVGVSGSAGKTTVKEMLASILSQDGKTAKNYKNWNNSLGVPLSVFATEGDEKYWVMEAGISLPGEMKTLAGILTPDLAVIHNVGPAHLEGLKSLDGVAGEKCVLLSHVRSGGHALVCSDYPELARAAKAAFPGVEFFSTKDEKSRFFGRRSGLRDGSQVFELALDGRQLEFCTAFQGGHILENILAAAGIAILLGVGFEEIKRGLSGVSLPEGRFNGRMKNGWLVIDDSYNANPLSMSASIRSARELAGKKPLFLVLGDMMELGGESESAHVNLGKEIAALGAECTVFFHGCFGTQVKFGINGGIKTPGFFSVDEPGEFIRVFRQLGGNEGVILFKGSRSRGMERFAQAFLKDC